MVFDLLNMVEARFDDSFLSIIHILCQCVQQGYYQYRYNKATIDIVISETRIDFTFQIRMVSSNMYGMYMGHLHFCSGADEI